MRFSHEVTLGISHGREPVACLSNSVPRARAGGYHLMVWDSKIAGAANS